MSLVWSSHTIAAPSNGLDHYGILKTTPRKADLKPINIPGIPGTKYRYMSFAQNQKDTYLAKGCTFFTTVASYKTWLAEIVRHQTDPLMCCADLSFYTPDIGSELTVVTNVLMDSFNITEPIQQIVPKGAYNFYCEWEISFVKTGGLV